MTGQPSATAMYFGRILSLEYLIRHARDGSRVRVQVMKRRRFVTGDEARGHKRGRLVGVELENGGGHNGKWSIFRAVWRRTEQYVR